MCFSPEGSFAVGACLLPAGTYCIRIAAHRNLRFLPLSAMPIFLGIQQIGEGFVWLGLRDGNVALTRVASLLFLFFALAFWPFWIPFSVLFIDERRRAKQMIGLIAVLGVAFGLAYYVPLAWHADRWLTTSVAYHSIRYNFDAMPALQVMPRGIWQLLYTALVFTPLIVAGNPRFTAFGVTLAVSAVVSHVVFWYAFVSVWCFFAAILSFQLCYFLRQLPVEPNRSMSPGTAGGHDMKDNHRERDV